VDWIEQALGVVAIIAFLFVIARAEEQWLRNSEARFQKPPEGE
jgi:hypothetical protein